MEYFKQNSGEIRLVIILCFKEVRIHLYPLIIAFFVPVLFVAYAYLLGVLYFDSFEVHECIYSMNIIAVLVTLLYGELFIAREKQKKKYIFLRTLPISDRITYLSKNIVGWCFLLISEIPGFLLLYIYFDKPPLIIYPMIVIAFLVFITTVTFFLILKSSFRVTFLITNIAAAIFVYLWRTFEESYPVLAAQITVNYFLYILASGLLLLGTYIFYRLGVRHFLKRDTRELVA